MPELKEKKCSMCGLVKAAGDFSKNKKSSDGLNTRCRQCCKIYMKRWKERQEKGDETPVESWGQVGDLIRSMSETQHAIQKTNSEVQRKINTLLEHANEAIEPWKLRLINQRIWIEEFFKKTGVKSGIKVFEFGSVDIEKNKIEFRLNPGKAGKRIGRP